ncbi:UNVERIFIED_CONTAM: hypothetical protein Sradi_6955200 [Sesamum radiatum]|uniref:Glycine-rich protein n=1 Tax=Sesamum radiatum TaxID=300843 RepID=A0AAW2JER8_SESRA
MILRRVIRILSLIHLLQSIEFKSFDRGELTGEGNRCASNSGVIVVNGFGHGCEEIRSGYGLPTERKGFWVRHGYGFLGVGSRSRGSPVGGGVGWYGGLSPARLASDSGWGGWTVGCV